MVNAEINESAHMMILCMNAGDLDRRNHSRGLLRLATNNCHIALLQEAQSTRLQDWCDYSGLVQSVVGECSVLAGASGTKHVKPLYGDLYRQSVPNTFSEHMPEVAWFHAVEARWYNGTEILTRAGARAWRLCTVHWHYDFVKGGRNSVGLAMLQLMYLMVRDKVRIVAGDFNQGFRYVTAVMEALMAKGLFLSYSKVHASDDHAGSGMEITAILINYSGSDVPCQVFRKESFQGLDNDDLGIKSTDTSCHIPLVFIVGRSDANPHRGGRSDESKAVRNKKRRTSRPVSVEKAFRKEKRRIASETHSPQPGAAGERPCVESTPEIQLPLDASEPRLEMEQGAVDNLMAVANIGTAVRKKKKRRMTDTSL